LRRSRHSLRATRVAVVKNCLFDNNILEIYLIQAELWQILCSSLPKFVAMATNVDDSIYLCEHVNVLCDAKRPTSRLIANFACKLSKFRYHATRVGCSEMQMTQMIVRPANTLFLIQRSWRYL